MKGNGAHHMGNEVGTKDGPTTDRHGWMDTNKHTQTEQYNYI